MSWCSHTYVVPRPEFAIDTHGRQDANLKRCFNRPEKIIDCDWSFISKARTTAEPHVPMPRLKDLLEYVATPGLEEIWILLDIKLDCDPTDVMRLIALTISAVPPSPTRAWKDRIVLGIWATKYLSLCEDYLPGFAVSHIGFSTTYARAFLKVPNISFNMLHQILHGPIGGSFIRKAKSLNREIFAWTVNDANRMRWCIRKQLDGVITDDPKKFLEICEDYEGGQVLKGKAQKELKATEKYHAGDWLQILKIQILVAIFIMLFKYRYGSSMEKKYQNVRKKPSWQEKILGRSM
jgi:glycerophosphoryl diester phosphodiesterase